LKKENFPSEKMKLLKKVFELSEISKSLVLFGKTMGFVPTMGALHEGHISLVRKCLKENDFCAVSIFVNPTQFNEKKDLKKYPRNLKKDMELLERENVDFVFVPSEKEMYPDGLVSNARAPAISKSLEGKFRKGHFDGVCTIVKKLLEIAPCQKAYFGQKDFQQYLVIKKMVSEFKIPVEIVLCPIVREKSGLAMSSRNKRLNAAEKKSALSLSKSLCLAKKMVLRGEKDAGKIKFEMKKLIENEKLSKIEYVEICDKENLVPLKKISKNAIALVAVWVGKIRLIDNSFL